MFCSLIGYSQSQKKIEQSYIDYFNLPRESFFVHTNKTTYLTGENLWFKIYIFDKLNKLPSVSTKNIHVGLYDSIGNQISKKLLLGRNGATNGFFEIDSTLFRAHII